jgi:DNA-binding NarL/FixJ family response regulator
MIRILLVDDQALFREGLHTLLSVQPDLQVVGEAGNGEEALRQTAALHPDVVLMDLRMPVLDGVAATRRLHETQPASRVIMLTTFDDDEYVFEGLRAGAVGYLLKDVPSEKLIEAIRSPPPSSSPKARPGTTSPTSWANWACEIGPKLRSRRGSLGSFDVSRLTLAV